MSQLLNKEKSKFNVEIIIKGKGGHSSAPNKTRNPIIIGFEIINAINASLAYQFDSFDDFMLIPISFEAGVKENIIPEEAYITYQGIFVDYSYSKILYKLLVKTAEAISALYGSSVEVHMKND